MLHIGNAESAGTEVGDGFGETFLKRDLRFPSEEFFSKRDIRFAALGIVGRKGLLNQF